MGRPMPRYRYPKVRLAPVLNNEHLSIEQLLLGTQVYMELTRRVLSGAV